MKIHGKQFIIEVSDLNEGILATESVIVTVENEGSGPFIQVRCQDLAGETKKECNSIGLSSLEEVDTLAMFLKKILKDAIDSDSDESKKLAEPA